jgi:hypothetical protein
MSLLSRVKPNDPLCNVVLNFRNPHRMEEEPSHPGGCNKALRWGKVSTALRLLRGVNPCRQVALAPLAFGRKTVGTLTTLISANSLKNR